MAVLGASLVFASTVVAQEAAPKSLDSRIKVELFAEHPQIVTPTGIDVDSWGRIWAVESNTHFPPEAYKGHPTDRVLVMSDTDGDGKADRIVVFTDGLKFTMSVATRPVWLASPSQAEGRVNRDRGPENHLSVYIATRREIRLFHDDDGDDRSDRSERIAELETKGDYPHNGLAGFAFDALGWLYFGCGENLGADYKLIGSDGTTLSGGGEGGNVYRCRLDGSKLERIATGFWNPHASCFDALGRLFTVDNDPDSRPPCRLLHIITGGDYGYRYRNGRAGLHPFSSWNGEIRGTLPMVAGTGEAPSGVLAYESDGLPDEYIGNLFATSWGDHRIDRFRLKPRGASFSSIAEPLIVGGENFRPVGIACAPDGSLYFTDWVKRDYTLHGQGRVWKISASTPRKSPLADVLTVSAARPVAELKTLLESTRLDLRRAGATALRQTEEGRRHLLQVVADTSQPARSRIESLWSIAQIPVTGTPVVETIPDLWTNILSVDEVGQAAYRLIGTPQFPVDRFVEWQKASGDKTPPQALHTEASSPIKAATLLAKLLRSAEVKLGNSALIPALLAADDPFLFAGVVNLAASQPQICNGVLIDYESGSRRIRNKPDPLQQAALLALRRLVNGQKPSDRLEHLLEVALKDSDESLRRAAIQWVAEERLTSLRPNVEAVLNDPQITSDLFLATLAALEMLDSVPPAQFDKTPPGKYVLPLVGDEKRTPTVRALALRLANPSDPALDGALLEKLLKSDDPALRLEAVRTLQSSPVREAAGLLAAIAADTTQSQSLRAEAIAGLAPAATRGDLSAETKTMLLAFLKGDDTALRSEALRSLRGAVAREPDVREAIEQVGKAVEGSGGPLVKEVALALGRARADDFAADDPAGGEKAERQRILYEASILHKGDAAAGRRIFFHANSAGCFKCHTVDGRGGKIGPDLSTIGRSHDDQKLVASILDPGKEIAPQYLPWSFETADGKVLTGMIVHENEGKTIVGDAEGKLTELKTIDIVQRVPQAKSVMPEKLASLMTVSEFRDLIAFLESLK